MPSATCVGAMVAVCGHMGCTGKMNYTSVHKTAYTELGTVNQMRDYPSFHPAAGWL